MLIRVTSGLLDTDETDADDFNLLLASYQDRQVELSLECHFAQGNSLLYGGNIYLRERLIADTLLDLDVKPLDLLVQRREWNAKVLRCLGLIPVTALKTVSDDALLDLFHHVEE